MAGIGFILQKLANRNDYLGPMRAFFYSAIISSGPWLLTIFSIGMISLFASQIIENEALVSFHSILLYNFAFSIVLSASLYIVTTRYIADRFYLKSVDQMPGILVLGITLILVLSFLFSVPFYFGFILLPFRMAVLAVINFLLLNMVWITILFLGAIKNYRAITLSFFLGSIFTVFFCVICTFYLGGIGLLGGFNLGLTYIVFSSIGTIVTQYPYPLRFPDKFFTYFPRFKLLVLAWTLYNAGIWVDKWIMWFAPEADLHSNGLRSFPVYDTAMFVAFLTVIPILALFIFSIETTFFKDYFAYFRHLRKLAPYHLLEKSRQELFSKMIASARNFLALQGTLSLVVVLMAPAIFDLLHSNYLELRIFRLGVLGAFFNILILFILIFLSYFDERKRFLLIAVLLFTSNGFFSWITREMGFAFYGYGYFISMLMTFTVSAFIFVNYVNKLNYHIFITNNVKKTSFEE